MPWVKRSSVPGSRWCSSCQTSPPIEGGEYVPFNSGRNRRWVCQNCKEKRNERNLNRTPA